MSESHDEIDDIMAEIERIKSGGMSPAQESSVPSPSETAVLSSVPSPSENAVLSSVPSPSEAAVLSSVPSHSETAVLSSVPRSVPSPSANQGPGTLSMTLSGSMKLALKYEVDGQNVTIGFEDSVLLVSLADGTEFKIPVGRGTRLRSVA